MEVTCSVIQESQLFRLYREILCVNYLSTERFPGRRDQAAVKSLFQCCTIPVTPTETLVILSIFKKGQRFLFLSM